MMNQKKTKMLLLYMLFGAGTTLVNLVLFDLFYYRLGSGTVISNIVSWVGSVLFAFVTNKWYVFESKDWNFRLTAKEFMSFAGCRSATGLLDLTFIYISVDMLHHEAMVMKILVNILVIILNFVGSKMIFKKK